MADTLDPQVGTFWPPTNDNNRSSRTGTGHATITMRDGKTYAVAHSKSEIARKRATTTPGSNWVAFDLGVPTTLQNTVVLDTSQIAAVT
jgi:hypothetical protein